ncbi:ATPase [Brasilonema octagenarum UFV-E1]|uniref:ATPase n=1 Tax=Brasilonema sennae CENA114 TaxID=415709 RepID=A0A856MIA8_9CYAN|nr:MoxR family ATPase [Brasilonema sennae]QDL10983.1 ATPase [Brasilonema sennae CENA114]QDL17329.1 ATPase [Brasilonema octagenarum UFV-E1]
MEDWRFFHGNGEQIMEDEVKEKLEHLKPPPWRRFSKKEDVPNDGRWEKLLNLAQEKDRNKRRGEIFRISRDANDVINAVNAAIYLRRPLLVTGKPGSGKTSLAYAIAYELNLGPVLSWGITARSTLQEGLYRYDAIARLQDAQQKEDQDIGKYITLGALGTAFLPSLLPRVLLIDEIDKSDINFPNDLLNIFEEGEFQIPELVRRAKSQGEDKQENNQEKRIFKVDTRDQDIDVDIVGGWVRCYAFPIIVMTSNGERDFPPAFKRRCVRVEMPEPKEEALKAIVKAHFKDEESLAQDAEAKINELIKEFLSDNKSDKNQNVERATDQLLNTIYLLTRDVSPKAADEKSIKDILLRSLNQ